MIAGGARRWTAVGVEVAGVGVGWLQGSLLLSPVSGVGGDEFKDRAELARPRFTRSYKSIWFNMFWIKKNIFILNYLKKIIKIIIIIKHDITIIILNKNRENLIYDHIYCFILKTILN